MSDPRRPDDETDALGRARQRAYEEFMAPGPLPPEANLKDAEARLLASIERAVRAPAAAPRRGGLGAWFARLAVPARRPALALAAVVVVAAGAWSLWQLGPRDVREARLLRGPAGSAAPGSWDARPVATVRRGDHVRLTWTPMEGATGYAVVFVSDDLAEIARVEGLTEPALELERGALPAGLVPGRAVLWRVSAYAGGDEVARSTTSTLTAP